MRCPELRRLAIVIALALTGGLARAETGPACTVLAIGASTSLPEGCEPSSAGCLLAEQGFEIVRISIGGASKGALLTSSPRWALIGKGGERVQAAGALSQGEHAALLFLRPTGDRSLESLLAPSGAVVSLAAQPTPSFACGDLSAPAAPEAPPERPATFTAPPDKVAYVEALRHLAAKQPADAERGLRDLVERHPDSPYAELAREALEPFRARPRRGFTFGMALTSGFGSLSLEQPEVVEEQGFLFQGDFRAGWMLTPSFAVLVGFSSGVLPAIKPTPNIVEFGASAQWFIADELWVRGGAGLGLAGQGSESSDAEGSDAEFDDAEFDDTSERASPSRGLGLRLGAGYELIHIQNPRRNHALSCELTLVSLPGPTNTALSVSAGLGYQWY